MRRSPVVGFALMGTMTLLAGSASGGTGYTETKLVSNLALVAVNQDPNLQGPWGLALSATSPFWVANQADGVATLYNGAGIVQALVVTIPPPSGGNPPSHPTGIVFNGSSDFGGKLFIFATEDGTICGWAGADGTTAIREVDNSGSSAVYKGLAIGNNGSANYLYATNFNAGTVEVYDSSYSLVNLSGSFTDPSIPSGFAPFGIQNINGVLFVTYAKQDGAAFDDVPGAGNGYVDRFDTNGNFLQRLVSAGPLNSPWGVALAPLTFGDFANDLLVGNAGDGTINAFNPTTGSALGTISDGSGIPIVLPRVLGLRFGNGGNGGSTNELYFTARAPQDEVAVDDGLFGKLTANPERVPILDPRGVALLALALAVAAAAALRGGGTGPTSG
jgi:uncharacterized protein (TIGR03118 family)